MSDITAASVVVSWNRPLEPNGVITNYSIHLYKRDDAMNEPAEKVIYTPNQRTEIIDLHAFTPYRIRMFAATSAGFGLLPSKVVTFNTSESGSLHNY